MSPALGSSPKEPLVKVRHSCFFSPSKKDKGRGKGDFNFIQQWQKNTLTCWILNKTASNPTWPLIFQNVLFRSITHVSYPELQARIQGSSLQQIKSRESRESVVEHENLLSDFIKKQWLGTCLIRLEGTNIHWKEQTLYWRGVGTGWHKYDFQLSKIPTSERVPDPNPNKASESNGKVQDLFLFPLSNKTQHPPTALSQFI